MYCCVLLLQMCVLGCLERQTEGASVVYLDTEKKFSGRRQVEVVLLFSCVVNDAGQQTAACWMGSQLSFILHEQP